MSVSPVLASGAADAARVTVHPNGYMSVSPVLEQLKVLEPSVLKDTARQKLQNVLDLSMDDALVLLEIARWDADFAAAKFFDVPDSKALGISFMPAGPLSATDTQRCPACLSMFTPVQSSSLPCGHHMCPECWTRCLQAGLKDGVAFVKATCFEAGCKERLRRSMVQAWGTAEDLERFDELMLMSVRQSFDLVRCPTASCTLTLARGSQYGDAACPCGHVFCTLCLGPPHEPLPCQAYAQFQRQAARLAALREKKQPPSRTTLRDCPRCRITIEKIGGCDHMTCRNCRCEFCWNCGSSECSKRNRWCGGVDTGLVGGVPVVEVLREQSQEQSRQDDPPSRAAARGERCLLLVRVWQGQPRAGGGDSDALLRFHVDQLEKAMAILRPHLRPTEEAGSVEAPVGLVRLVDLAGVVHRYVDNVFERLQQAVEG
mmetsp:Transcript_29357/g.62596  ORF Transcript_29357/g.62596 Transcript_29357/m.62596 type:complete len:430 (+) Transcript_29357:2-1291(+)